MISSPLADLGPRCKPGPAPVVGTCFTLSEAYDGRHGLSRQSTQHQNIATSQKSAKGANLMFESLRRMSRDEMNVSGSEPRAVGGIRSRIVGIRVLYKGKCIKGKTQHCSSIIILAHLFSQCVCQTKRWASVASHVETLLKLLP